MTTITKNLIINGKKHTITVDGEVRLLWVLRDMLKIHGPKYGCGLDVCKACTSHIVPKDGAFQAFNPCSVQIKAIPDGSHITTIEGLPNSVQIKAPDLHPMQEAWLDRDVVQCGYCQPGQIMAAVALVKEKGSADITEADLDTIRNICRCGTYHRIREAIVDGAQRMADAGLIHP